MTPARWKQGPDAGQVQAFRVVRYTRRPSLLTVRNTVASAVGMTPASSISSSAWSICWRVKLASAASLRALDGRPCPPGPKVPLRMRLG